MSPMYTRHVYNYTVPEQFQTFGDLAAIATTTAEGMHGTSVHC